MKRWLVRHAQPQIEPGICYGRLDVAANLTATLDTAQVLAATLPLGLHGRYSPLQRCSTLAEQLLALRPDIDLIPDKRLQEMDFGCWEGVAWNAIGQHHMDAWVADFAQHRFGGHQSVAEFIAEVASLWDDSERCGQDTLWLTHAGVIRACYLLQQGIRLPSQASEWPVHAPDFGGVICLERA